MQTPPTRNIRFNMLLNEAESGMLRELSEAHGLTQSDWLRLMIREAHKKTSKAGSK